MGLCARGCGRGACEGSVRGWRQAGGTSPPELCVPLSRRPIQRASAILALGRVGFCPVLRVNTGTARSERMRQPTNEAERSLSGCTSATLRFWRSHTSSTICGASSSGGSHVCRVIVSYQSGSLVLDAMAERSWPSELRARTPARETTTYGSSRPSSERAGRSRACRHGLTSEGRLSVTVRDGKRCVKMVQGRLRR